jgi:aminoglycoside phosphotransferase (APT) family kinase protein
VATQRETGDVAVMAAAMGVEPLVEWVEATLGGRVIGIEPLARWRAGWFLDLQRGDEVVALYARGARGPDFPSPYGLEHEVAVHELLEAHGIPVPHAYGIVDLGFTQALVMDRVRGVQGLMSVADEATRRRLMLECVEHMAAMHRIPADELARRGFEVPQSPDEIVWSGAIARLERHYLASGVADPVIEFLRLWLRRHVPQGRTRPAFVTWDAAQFLHADGKLTALIDFELAHVGDPYMDLSPLRSRDTMEPFGDLAGAFARYAELTGEPIDFDVVRWFEIAQLTATLMLQRPVLLAPDRNSDLVTHIVWYVESARYAFDVMAELLHTTLDHVEVVDAPPSPHRVAHAHLVASLHAVARTPARDRGRGDADPGDHNRPEAVMRRWQARCDYRLARHLQRVDEIGAIVARAELDDAATVLGRRPGADDALGADAFGADGADGASDAQAIEAALVELIRLEDPARDIELLRYLDRRMQRSSMLLGPPDALLVQHVPMQPLPV